MFFYRANTLITTGDPGSGDLLWNNATQASATQLNISVLTDDNIDISLFLAELENTEKVTIQDQSSSANYQRFQITGTPTDNTTYWSVPEIGRAHV